ncbi:MAG TPA: amidase family protein [Jatrophihabitans sp.]|nr:amidase family protein [Jatrophihabitans sp.]
MATRFLARIERIDPQLHAVLALAPDALRAAAASDRRRQDGESLGPLDGVPILIKDNIEAIGLPGCAGSRALASSPVLSDAPLVARLRAAGLIVLGATNLSEWANFRSTGSTSGWSAVGGQTSNPFALGHNPSGSSSGSGAAVAAGLAPWAVGTETDGSIVSPAGHCGLVGFKPTVGTVPGAGIVPISPVQDTAGPMTRSVLDAALLYGVLADQTEPATAWQPPELDGVPVAVWRPAGLTAALAEVLDAVEARLAQAGAHVVPARLAAAEEPSGPFADAEFEALVGEFAVALPAYLAERAGSHPRTWPELLAFNRADDVELSQFGDEIFELAARADQSRAGQARQACLAAASRELASVLGECAFAVTVTNGPAAPIRYGQADHEAVSTSSLCAITGAPSLTLPGMLVTGLPVGISLLGRRDHDRELLAWGLAVERLLPVLDYPEL